MSKLDETFFFLCTLFLCRFIKMLFYMKPIRFAKKVGGRSFTGSLTPMQRRNIDVYIHLRLSSTEHSVIKPSVITT